jgi:hypothetical protein
MKEHHDAGPAATETEKDPSEGPGGARAQERGGVVEQVFIYRDGLVNQAQFAHYLNRGVLAKSHQTGVRKPAAHRTNRGHRQEGVADVTKQEENDSLRHELGAVRHRSIDDSLRHAA